MRCGWAGPGHVSSSPPVAACVVCGAHSCMWRLRSMSPWLLPLSLRTRPQRTIPRRVGEGTLTQHTPRTRREPARGLTLGLRLAHIAHTTVSRASHTCVMFPPCRCTLLIPVYDISYCQGLVRTETKTSLVHGSMRPPTRPRDGREGPRAQSAEASYHPRGDRCGLPPACDTRQKAPDTHPPHAQPIVDT